MRTEFGSHGPVFDEVTHVLDDACNTQQLAQLCREKGRRP
jgi:hypothetical protein